jgi:iron complex transport system substrate-binding protein
MAARRLDPAFSLLAASLVLLAACGRPATRDAITITDDWSRRVALASPARRIVSLSPATTELAFALGLGARLVGRTTWCDYPDSAREVADVGNGIGPNVEAVASRRPDLVLLYASEANRQALGRLEALGIPTLALRVDLAADLARAATLLAKAAGDAGAARRLLGEFERELAEARREPPDRERLKVYVDVEPNPPITLGGGSYLTEIIAAAGARNVFDDLPLPSAVVSLEAIARRDPDVVLALSYDANHPPQLSGRPGWRALRAVREGRVVAVDASLFGRPSPRMPAAVRELRRKLEALPGVGR